ncbi:MAG: PP0621 family protein [Betaproteobacteria bacterium]
MGRLILIVLIVLLVLWLLRRALAAGKRAEPPSGGGATAPELVSCAHCGVNLPRAEARSAGGRHYCSEEHWRLGPRED